MAQGRYVGKDVGGFGRLADINLQNRREERLDADADLRHKLQAVQLQQAEMNIETIRKDRQFKAGLAEIHKNPLPDGETKFTTAYKYSMSKGNPEYAQKLMAAQSKAVERLWKMGDKPAAKKMYDSTLGKVQGGVTINPAVGGLITASTPDGKSITYQPRVEGWTKVNIPEGIKLPTNEDEDLSLEVQTTLAIKYNTDGKRPFPQRGKWGNRMNGKVIGLAAQIRIDEGKSSKEFVFDVKDREAIQKSIQQQEKQYGSMHSFVINMDKQVDEISKIGKELKRFDTRLWNMPINVVAQKILGDPKLAKYHLYLSEIQREVSKLSQGATGSVAQLPSSEQKHWEKILDTNISIPGMLEVLGAVKIAGNVRLESVQEALAISRERLREVGEDGDKVAVTTPKEARKAKRIKHEDTASYLDERGAELEEQGYSEDDAYEKALKEAKELYK